MTHLLLPYLRRVRLFEQKPAAAPPPLIRALVDQDPLALRRLLAAGAVPAAIKAERDPEEPTAGSPIHPFGFALLCEEPELRLELLRLLLRAGADANAPLLKEGDQESLFCLSALAHMNDAEGVRLLLAHGADPIAADPFAYGSALHAAAQRNASAALSALLEATAGKEPDAPQGSPLHIAAMEGAADAVALLLSHGADPAAEARSGVLAGYAALHVAALSHEHDTAGRCIELILAAGVSVDLPSQGGRTAIEHVLATLDLHDDPEDLQRLFAVVVTLLRAGADIDRETLSGRTPRSILHALLSAQERLDLGLLAGRAI